MSKKFLSDVLIECGLQVDGTTTLGTATATTVATSDNSTNIATTAWVKSLGYSTADSYISSVSLNGNSLDFTGINSAFTGSIDLSGITSSFNPSDVETVYERVKNTSGSIIYKGTPLAVVPGQTSGNISDVIPADASDPAKMPAVFIANENIADGAEGEAVLFGRFSGVDTSLYQSGTTVYVAVGGGWTATKPVWPNLIQNLGVITKQHATNGAGVVTGVGRANALPNLTAGKIWVGTANYPIESTTVHVDEANARVGIGTTSPSDILHVRKSGANTRMIVGNNAAYDQFIYFQGNNDWSIGIDNSNSNAFTLSNYSTIGTNDKLTVTTSGNVGIGTTSPSQKLEVNGNIAFSAKANSLIFGSAGTDGTWGAPVITRIGTKIIMSDYSGVQFGGYDGSAYGARMTVLGTGNVGIGTTSPNYKLDVAGNAYFQSYVSTSSYYTGPLYKVAYSGSYNGVNSVGNEAILARVSSTSGIINYAEYAISNLNGYVIGQSDAMIKGNYSSDDLYILTTNAIRVYVASNSNGGGVGIGSAFNDSVPPQEKLHVKGNVRIEGSSTSATLETTDKVADPAGAVYATYPTNSTYGAFVDYVVYDSGRDSMRVGTMRATWNANEVVYADVSTVDIGDTSVVTMTAVLNGTDVDLVVTGDAVFTVKLNVKVIR